MCAPFGKVFLNIHDDTGTAGQYRGADVHSDINGVTVGASQASDDTASNSDNSGSGIDLAAAINKVGDQTGVTAKVNATELVGGSAQTSTANTAAA